MEEELSTRRADGYVEFSAQFPGVKQFEGEINDFFEAVDLYDEGLEPNGDFTCAP